MEKILTKKKKNSIPISNTHLQLIYNCDLFSDRLCHSHYCTLPTISCIFYMEKLSSETIAYFTFLLLGEKKKKFRSNFSTQIYKKDCSFRTLLSA